MADRPQAAAGHHRAGPSTGPVRSTTSNGSLHLPSELSLQHFVLDYDWLARATNYYYAVVHVPATIAFLVWLFVRHRDHYPHWRNGLAIVTAFCLVIRFVRVAPPRFLPDLGYIDLSTKYGLSVYGPVGTGVSDQFAAMPSIHVAWAAVVSFGIIAASPSKWRWVFGLQVVLTMLAVSASGNHWWLDGIVAIALLGVALAIDTAVRRRAAARARSASDDAAARRSRWRRRDSPEAEPIGSATPWASGSDQSKFSTRSRSLGFRSSDSSASWINRIALAHSSTSAVEPRRRDAVAVGRGERRQPGPQLVGAVPAQLALVALLQLLASAALLAVARDLLVERGDLLLVTLGQRFRRGIDHHQQVGRGADGDRPRAVQLVRDVGERGAPLGQSFVAGEHAGAADVAERCDGGRRRRGRVDAFGDQAFGDHVGADGPEVDAHAARRDRDEVVRHEVTEDQEHRGRWRFLDRLQHHRRALGPQQVELVEDQHLAVALGRSERRHADDLARLLRRDRGAGASDLANVGMRAEQDQACVALVGVVAAGDQAGGEGPRRRQLRRTARTDEEVRVDRPAVRRQLRSWATARS